jgi:hypothetical protein
MDMEWQTMGMLAAGVVALIVVGFALLVWAKGQPFAEGAVFRASRLSGGNRLLPTQVLVTPTSVVHFTPQWIGKYEHSIHMAHVASVGIDTHLLFSDVRIETTGGTSAIHCKGHHKADAVRMKQLIEQYQADYYKSAAPASGPPRP